MYDAVSLKSFYNEGCISLISVIVLALTLNMREPYSNHFIRLKTPVDLFCLIK